MRANRMENTVDNVMESVARAYIEHQYRVVPVPFGSKAPAIENWQELQLGPEDISVHFGADPLNIGIILGDPENPIADVDCDCPEAVRAAQLLLPATETIFGREANGFAGHHLFRLPHPIPSRRLVDPADNQTLIELRCAAKDGTTGKQTLVPPSRHPSGEDYRWRDFRETHGPIASRPSLVDVPVLTTAVSRIAAVALFARHWPDAGQGRHACMLALAGTLARAKWTRDAAFQFCDAVYRSLSNPDPGRMDRVRSEIDSTFEKHERGEEITGVPSLSDFLDQQVGQQVVQRGLQWLKIDLAKCPSTSATPVPSGPVIQIKDRPLHEVTDDALAALVHQNDPPTLFISGDAIAAVENGSIAHVDETVMRTRMSRSATWLRGLSCVFPPSEVTKVVMAEARRQRVLPVLEGVVAAPTIRADGTILATPGYDAASARFYQPDPRLSVPPVPDAPTQTDIQAAVARIDDLIADFPFDGEASRANAIAALLTPVLRPVINGPTPLAIFDATAPGTGKSLLAKIVSIVVAGSDAAMRTAPKTAEEWRKKITSFLRTGTSLVILDNVSRRLDSDELGAVLSAEIWSDRLLSLNVEVSLPVRCAWIVTANNIQLDRQIARRSYLIRMDARTARPFLRNQFRHPDLLRFALQHRGEILAALLTLARAWFAAGCPKPSIQPLGTYEARSLAVGGILQQAGITGFLGNLDELLGRGDDETQHWGALLTRLDQVFKVKPFGAGDVVMASKQDDILKDTLDAIFGQFVSDEAKLKQKIGRAFNEKLQRRFESGGGELWLDAAGTRHRVGRWRVGKEQKSGLRVA